MRQDVMYGDIDHFDNNRDFTYDMVKFAGLPQYIEQLQDDGMRFIIILVYHQYSLLSMTVLSHIENIN